MLFRHTHEMQPEIKPPTGWSVRGEYPNAALLRYEEGIVKGEWPICQQEGISVINALTHKVSERHLSA